MTKPVESLFSISHFGFALLLETLLKNEKREKAFSSYYVGLPIIKVSFTPPNINVGVRYLIFKIIATKNTATSKQKQQWKNVTATRTFFIIQLPTLSIFYPFTKMLQWQKTKNNQ